MAYGKIEKFAKTNNTAKEYLETGNYFEAWITYIREADLPADKICEDVDQEVYTKKCKMTEDEKAALQFEANDYLELRRYE